MPVKNPCGLKNPMSQNETGLPVVYQVLSWLYLFLSPSIQPPSVGVNHEISVPVGSYHQLFGTLKLNIDLIALTISGVIMIAPSTAKIIFFIVALTLIKIFWNRVIS